MITTAQLAVLLAITEQTVSQYAKHGKLPGAVKVGNRWRFPDDVVERMHAADEAPKPQAVSEDPWAQSNQSRGRKRSAA